MYNILFIVAWPEYRGGPQLGVAYMGVLQGWPHVRGPD